MGIPATAAYYSNGLCAPARDYSQFQFTFTAGPPAATAAYTNARPPWPGAHYTMQRVHPPHHHFHHHRYEQQTSPWYIAQSGLSLAAFPYEPTANVSYTKSADRQFQFHLAQRQPVASSSRSVFGANNTEGELPWYNHSTPVHAALTGSLCKLVLSSPSDSVMSSITTPSPAPEYVHVICNAPLVAPKPLPYHSPTFLQFDLPDDDEDLSHPPYVSRPHKRKREEEAEEEEAHKFVIMKRRATDAEGHGRWNSEAVYPYFQRPQMRSHAMPTSSLGQYTHRHR